MKKSLKKNGKSWNIFRSIHAERHKSVAVFKTTLHIKLKFMALNCWESVTDFFFTRYNMYVFPKITLRAISRTFFFILLPQVKHKRLLVMGSDFETHVWLWKVTLVNIRIFKYHCMRWGMYVSILCKFGSIKKVWDYYNQNIYFRFGYDICRRNI